jgi:hypothetical protein
MQGLALDVDWRVGTLRCLRDEKEQKSNFTLFTNG